MPINNILIADDNQNILHMLEEILRMEGYQTFLVSNGEEAVEATKKNPIDVAILDKKMPIMDGIEALKQIKKIDATIEVLIMTGYADIETLQQSLIDYGAFDYLLKPLKIKREGICNAVRNALLKRAHAVKDDCIEKELNSRILQLEKEFEEKTRQLRESQIKYKEIVDNSTDGIFIAQDENLQFVNPKVLELTGFTEKEILSTPFINLVYPEDRPMVSDRFMRSLQGGETPGPYIFRILTKDGGSFWVEINSVKTIWEERPAVMSNIKNINDRVESEKKLRESEEKYRTLFESSKDPIYIATRDGAFVDVNRAFLDLFGYTRGDLTDLRAQDVYVNPGQRVIFQEEIEKKRFVRDYELKLRKKNGEEMNCLVTASVRQPDDRSIPCYQGFIRDVTEQRRAENELTKSREQLRNLSAYLQSAREQERTSIAREIHDYLGQTLTVLKMDLSWLGKWLSKDQEPLKERHASMDRALDMAIESVERIITELRPGLLDDLGLVAAIEWQVGDFQNRTGVKSEITIDPEEIVLKKERSTAIFRILQECLTNVARHAHATKVSVTLIEKDGEIALNVRDNGKGIAREQISHPKSFGLMGIRERVHVFGGDVKITGTLEKGTTVTVRIPREKDS